MAIKRNVGDPVNWDKYSVLITFDSMKVFLERKDKKAIDISWGFYLASVIASFLFVIY